MAMLVNIKSAKKCCAGCNSEFGGSPNRKAKQQLKRGIRSAEKQAFRNNLRKNLY